MGTHTGSKTWAEMSPAERVAAQRLMLNDELRWRWLEESLGKRSAADLRRDEEAELEQLIEQAASDRRKGITVVPGSSGKR